MENKKPKKTAFGKWKFTLLLLYFTILTVERIISLITCFTGDVDSFALLDYYMVMLTIFAMFGAHIFVVMRCTDIVSSKEDNRDIFPELAVAAGILLLGGMVHTNGSIPVMQFISYGMILGSMAIHTAENVKRSNNADIKWLSFAYIVAYSMAIPVVYHTNIELDYIFIPVECAVSVGMVAMFTIMLTRFYNGNGESGFGLLPYLIALFGDVAVLALRWEEEVNVFVLIFLCVTSALWFAGKIMYIKRKKTKK